MKKNQSITGVAVQELMVISSPGGSRFCRFTDLLLDTVLAEPARLKKYF